jgi:hypothetical protein
MNLEVDFPLGLEGTEGLPNSRRGLGNCFNAGGPIIQRPGISALGTNGRVARGAFEWNGSLYEVASTDLLKINTDGTYTVVGTIAGVEPIESAIGFNDAVIVVKGGNGYTLDKTDTITQITDPDYLPSDDVCHINGRFVYIPSDGSPAFFSDVGAAGTIQASSFFDAEELPDSNKTCFNFKGTLYIGGTDSFEPFRDFGTPTVPYQRLNARIDNGYLGGLLEYNNTFLFLGREKNQDVGFYSISQGMAPKISNEHIDTILKTYAEAELAECISGRVKWNGFDLATFTLARHSWGFYGGNWFDLDTRIDGVNFPWQAGYIVEFGLKYYSFNSDDIGVFARVNTDYGLPFERRINGAFEGEGEFAIQRLEYRLSQGYNSSIGSVSLQVSDDNVLFGPVFHRETGALGEYASRLEWNYPGGLGQYDGLMAYKLSTAENVDFSATKLMIDPR